MTDLKMESVANAADRRLMFRCDLGTSLCQTRCNLAGSIYVQT